MSCRLRNVWLPTCLMALAALAGAENAPNPSTPPASAAAPKRPAKPASPTGSLTEAEKAAEGELAQFCQQADFIVHGRVAQRAMTVDQKGHIWTTYTVQVTDALKTPAGRPCARLEIRQLGGQVGGRRQIATETAQFHQGEEVILFTRDFGKGWQSVTNGARGCLRVRTLRTAAPGGQTRERRICPEARQLQRNLPTGDLDQLKRQLRVAIQRGQQMAVAPKRVSQPAGATRTEGRP